MEEKANMLTEELVESLLSSYVSSPIIQKLNDYYGEKSFLEILRVERKEIYHSNFLKWLFEDQDTCMQANLNLLILLLKRSRLQHSHFPEWLKKILLTNSIQIRQVKVKLEDFVESNSIKGRGDILIKIRLLENNDNERDLYVFMENKVESQEHNVGTSNKTQTQAYYDYYTGKYGRDNILFVYLTPISPVELRIITEPMCACKEFIQINYQDLLDNVLILLSENASIPQKKQFYIKEYIKGLSTNFSQNNIIMALEPRLRDLLTDFWDNNHQLIELSIDALTQDPDLEGDEKEAIEKVNKSIKELAKKRDTTRYSIDGQGKFGKCAMIYEIVRKYLQIKNYDVTLLDLQKVFPHTWRGKTSSLSNMVVIGKDQFEKDVNERSKWRWKQMDKPLNSGEFVYVTNQWGNANHMRKVIEKINGIPDLANVRIAEISR